MGTWGIGVWQDDVAADLLVEFDRLLDGGSTAAQAVERAWAGPPYGWDDDDDDDVVQVLALAALALEQGVLAPELRDRALQMMESGAALQRWTDSVAELEGATAERRQFVQQRLQARQELLERLEALLKRGRATAEELTGVTRPEAFRVGPWQ